MYGLNYKTTQEVTIVNLKKQNTMKKVFLSFAFLAAVLGASAQSRSGREGASDAILRGGYPTANSSHSGNNGWDKDDHRNDRGRNDRDRREREERARRDEAIRRINADYDYRIARVREDRHLRNRDRKRQIESLQRERLERIRDVQNDRYGNYRGY